MKKLFILALCAAAVGSAGAQKAAVDAAKKMAGKLDKVAEARAAINEAIANPETATQPNTYVVAADIELKAYDKLKKDLGVDPANSDPAKLAEMDDYLLKAYPLMCKIAEYAANDSKGKALSEAQNRLMKYSRDYWQAGADLFNAQKFDGAYNAFMAYGDIPALPFMDGKAPIVDSDRATSYYNAGLSGWSIPDLPKAAEAFKQARLAGYEEPQAYIYELACWQNMMQNDSTLTAAGQQAIFECSEAAYGKFGLAQPVFLNNMINVLVERGQEAQAIERLNQLITATPSPALYGLRGFVYDRMDKNAESEADYRAAAQMQDADYETLLNAAKKIYREGAEKWNAIEGTSPEALNQRKDVRTNYFEWTKAVTDRAAALAKAANAEKEGSVNTSQLDYLVEQVDYALENFR